MTSVPLGIGAYDRRYGQEPEIQLVNRFFEQTPTNQIEASTLLARPGTTFFVSAGNGPIRWIGNQEGAFNDDLFFVSGETLYRYDGTNAPIAINGTIQLGSVPSATFVAGPSYEHLFIADGVTLQYYDGISAATGTLTSTGAIADNDEIAIGAVHYRWVSGSVDAGTPDGASANPWLVALGADNTAAFANMVQALNASGTAGTTYSTGLTQLTNVAGVLSNATTMNVRARVRGADGNTITTTVQTGANISWGGATLSGGGAQSLNGVQTPDDVAIVAVETLNSFVVAVVANSQRFYWVRPAELIIDALDFAEAEREPDQILNIVRVGDALYLLGASSTEVWYSNPSTDPDAASFLPQQGLAFNQGILAGTAASIRNFLIVIAQDGVTYQITGGPQRISTHGIEERTRLARRAQQLGA